jgi:hypothetical protein
MDCGQEIHEEVFPQENVFPQEDGIFAFARQAQRNDLAKQATSADTGAVR